VSQVSGQARQQVLKVGAASIPRDESVNGSAVSQIVQTGLSSRSALTGHLRDRAQQTERSLDR
jgi:hypothetical protein